MRLFQSLVVLALVSCTGALDSPPGTGRGGRRPEDPPVEACRQPSQRIFIALRPTCEGCHGPGTSFPAFADLESFEQLVAYDPRIVAARDPDASRLVALLEGRADGTYSQMPLAGDPFSTRAGRGETDATMADVRGWISALETCELPPIADPPLTRRVSTNAIRAALYEQLGLVDADFFGVNYDETFSPQRMPLRSPHDVPGLLIGGRSETGAAAFRNWRALGGPDFIAGAPSDRSPSSNFVSTLIPLSQAWCRMAVDRPGNTALFRDVSADATSATSEAQIRANIRYLELRMLGIEAAPEDVDRLYTGVFVPIESGEGPRTAWVAVCSSLIRHPLWLSE